MPLCVHVFINLSKLWIYCEKEEEQSLLLHIGTVTKRHIIPFTQQECMELSTCGRNWNSQEQPCEQQFGAGNLPFPTHHLTQAQWSGLHEDLFPLQTNLCSFI